jgi:hypothetical protein
MLKWNVINPNATKVQAFPCAINRGIIDENGKQINLPARIYVDDALMLATSIEQMKMVLAAMIEAIFTVMGEPNNSVCQCPLAMDKWTELVIGPRQIGLGLIIDTNRHMVAIPLKYLKEVRDLLDSTWHPNRCRFKVSEAQKLTGKLATLAEGANWVFHLLSHLYSSIAYTLAENKHLLMESSQEFRNIILLIQTGAFFTSCKDLAHSCAPYFIRHEMCSKVNTSLILSVQHQQNHACRNRILSRQP